MGAGWVEAKVKRLADRDQERQKKRARNRQGRKRQRKSDKRTPFQSM